MIQYYDVPRSLFLEVFPVGLGSRHFIVILPKIVWKVHFAFYNQKAVKKKEQEWELNQTPLGTNVSTLPLRCCCLDDTGGIGDYKTIFLKKRQKKIFVPN